MMKSDVGPLAGDAIVVEHLVVRRGGGDVLPDLSVRVPAGQVVGLLGPSGGGKSTLMRAIVGVQQVESGADEGAVDRAIAAVDLTSHADVKVSRLSGGEHSRASLAAALVGSPEVLVLDEPTAMLDAEGRGEVLGRVRELSRSRTVLHVTHHLEELFDADRILVLNGGLLAADTEPQHLFSDGDLLRENRLVLPTVPRLAAGLGLPFCRTPEELAAAVRRSRYGVEAR